MALHGTFETVEVPDVLRLLASAGKTGVLTVTGDRGASGIALAGGRVADAYDASGASADPEAVLFGILRNVTGSFAFDAIEVPESTEPSDLEAMLAAAEAQLVEWREIAAVVPTLDVSVRLASELAVDSVKVSADRWRAVARIGGGTTVADLGTELGLGEIPVSRVVCDLVEAGLVVVEPVVAHDDVDSPVLPVEEPTEASPAPPADSSTISMADPVEAEPAPSWLDQVAIDSTDGSDDVAEDVASWLTAPAPDVPALPGEDSDDDRPAAAVHDPETEANRNLLIRFLSSVNE